MQLANKALALGGRNEARDDGPTAGMCEPCRAKYPTITDTQRRCDLPGCDGTWTWTAAAQLEAFAAKRPAPRVLCAGCETKLAALTDKEIACGIPGCTRKAIVSRRAQLLGDLASPSVEKADGKADGKAPQCVTFPGPLCAPCDEVARKLADRPVACGIAGCNRKWIWKADDQIQAFAAGKPNEPPRRMCDACRAEFGKLNDREIRCRTSGCKKTWTWVRMDQLDACVANKPAPKAPSRMCETCFDLFSHIKDVERPCRRSGCKRTWTDKRGAQLARAARGKTGDPYPHYCTECEKELGDLQDREVGCKTVGCAGSWTWSKEQQLAAGVRLLKPLPPIVVETVPAADGTAATPEVTAPPVATQASTEGDPKKKPRRGKRHREPKPPERLCATCVDFLTGKKTLEIPCSHCATPIYWPPESQLQTHLGNWAVPSMCGACKRDATEAARQAAREALRAGPAPAPIAAPAIEPPPET